MAGLIGRAFGKKKEEPEKVEIPFDLNQIFTLTYGFEPLKEVIEYIFGQLKANDKKIHDVDTKLVSKMMMLSE